LARKQDFSLAGQGGRGFECEKRPPQPSSTTTLQPEKCSNWFEQLGTSLAAGRKGGLKKRMLENDESREDRAGRGSRRATTMDEKAAGKGHFALRTGCFRTKDKNKISKAQNV